jgi:hypothetical protein
MTLDKYPQHHDIERYLSAHPAGLTAMEAFEELKITKLATRVSEMLRLGYRIDKIPEVQTDRQGRVIRRYMRYRKAAA